MGHAVPSTRRHSLRAATTDLDGGSTKLASSLEHTQRTTRTPTKRTTCLTRDGRRTRATKQNVKGKRDKAQAATKCKRDEMQVRRDQFKAQHENSSVRTYVQRASCSVRQAAYVQSDGDKDSKNPRPRKTRNDLT